MIVLYPGIDILDTYQSSVNQRTSAFAYARVPMPDFVKIDIIDQSFAIIDDDVAMQDASANDECDFNALSGSQGVR